MTVSIGTGVSTGNIVTAETNPLTGGLEKVTAGGVDIVTAFGARMAQRKTTAIIRPIGLTQASAYSSSTDLSIKMEAEAPFSRVRLHFCSEAGAATNFKLAACVTETAATNTGNAASQPVVGGTAYPAVQSEIGAPGWQIGTVGGVSNFDWPGLGSANAPKRLSTDWFDICNIPRADGGARPLFMFRLEHDSSANGNIGSGSTATWETLGPGNPWYRVFQTPNISGGGSVTDLTKLGYAGGSTGAWVEVEFQYNTPALTVLGIGDSNLENAGTNSFAKFATWGWMGTAGASTVTMPLAWVNAGSAGAGNAVYAGNGFSEIARIKPEVVVYAAGTSNDVPITALILERWKSRLARTIYEAQQVGARVIAYGPLPGIAYTAPYEVFRLAMRKHCIDMSANGAIDYLDFESLLGTGASPNRLAAGMTADGGTHVSNAAEIAMAALLTAKLNQMLA